MADTTANIDIIRTHQAGWLADGQRAIALAQDALDILPPAWYFTRSSAHLILVFGYHMTDERDKAYAHLEYALAKKSSRPFAYITRFLIEVLALQALLYNAQDNEETALEMLGRALNLAEPGGFIRLFVDLGFGMATLLRRCISQNGPVGYLSRREAVAKVRTLELLSSG